MNDTFNVLYRQFLIKHDNAYVNAYNVYFMKIFMQRKISIEDSDLLEKQAEKFIENLIKIYGVSK